MAKPVYYLLLIQVRFLVSSVNNNTVGARTRNSVVALGFVGFVVSLACSCFALFVGFACYCFVVCKGA